MMGILDIQSLREQTLSRITNWEKMSIAERERTMRVLNARNK